ncbi:MAG: UDP-N-acetylmuramoyl-L-alanyl-D-glutamate--2,6-diaminopimelate ligase [Spirochaetaceae bacterium]|nr:UDP-N-acetylmuramoyl-L-alanyl-D-glutamate--2,6-diaminopimelate ligase [Spirochaetaceae bacterium]
MIINFDELTAINPEWGINKIVFDSREAGSRTIFCALTGLHTDGHLFITKAKEQGCRFFLIEDKNFADDSAGFIYLLAANSRLAMAKLSAIFYDYPSKKIKVIGVTGTDGKSTTSYLIYQLLTLLGYKVGLISTVSLKIAGNLEDNNMRQSTPEAPQIEEALSQMFKSGLDYAVLEATSHGLAEETGRLKYINFVAGVFTNLTIEHLEFHKTFENYRQAKANLFRKVAAHKGITIINIDDEHSANFIEAAKGSIIITYGRNIHADYNISREESLPTSNNFVLSINNHSSSHNILVANINLAGAFNIENSTAAFATVVNLLKLPPEEVIKFLPQLTAPTGRMKIIQTKPFGVIVDYAHTPGSFAKLLPQMKENLTGRMLVVFGSAGERNKEKRPLQGELADNYADIIILTDEDPRLEGSLPIIEDIAKGIKNKKLNETLFFIPDRTTAITKAYELAKTDDLVLLLGKGHERSIFMAHGKEPWHEEEVAKALLNKN